MYRKIPAFLKLSHLTHKHSVGNVLVILLRNLSLYEILSCLTHTGKADEKIKRPARLSESIRSRIEIGIGIDPVNISGAVALGVNKEGNIFRKFFAVLNVL